MIVAGIGCRKGVAETEIVAAVEAALAHLALGRQDLHALATGPTKAGEPGLRDAARHLGLPLEIAGEAALAAVGPQLLTRSAKSRAATGSDSISEAAALAIAGPGARLLAPRFIRGGVTIAFATSCGDMP